MKRWLLAGVLGVLVIGAVQAEDVVDYFDRAAKKKETARGTIEEETSNGITIKGKGKDAAKKKIAADDIIEIQYGVPGMIPADYRKPFVKEGRAITEKDAKKRATALEVASDAFKDLDKEIKGNAAASRYVQYKIAQIAVLLAKDDPSTARADAAIKALTDYKTANPGGWEIVPALKELARLQQAAGKTDDARKSYEELADVPDLPKELKTECDLLVGRLLLHAKKYADAEKRLKVLDGALSADDPQKAYIQAYLAESQLNQGNTAEAEKKLREALKEAPDGKLRGVIHNLLGDYYRRTGKEKEAFWHYLRVDALYNDDPEEQAKALYYLAGLFTKEKRDPVRGKECLTRLKEERFAGTEYQKLAATVEEKK